VPAIIIIITHLPISLPSFPKHHSEVCVKTTTVIVEEEAHPTQARIEGIQKHRK